MIARKIAAWHEAGLIDAATRDRLLAHEAAHARPLALWAVFGIGALAIGLGLVSLIAANWEEIPGQFRLGVHLALIVGALAALFVREDRLPRAAPWAVEALVFVTAALGLTFFGHLGQVYQTSSPLWQPLAMWLLLFSPLLLLMGRSWPAALAVLGGAVWCAWDHANAMTVSIHPDAPSLPGLLLWSAFVIALPVLFAPAAAGLRGHSARPGFWRRLEQSALAYAVAGASFATVVASAGEFDGKGLAGDWPSMAVIGATALAAGLGVIALRPGVSGRMAGSIIAGAAAVPVLAYVLNDLEVPAALLFMVLWAGIATAALAAHWRGVFNLAVAVIAVRLIILSFELASDLLLSGFGLIFSGVLILGVAWTAVRVSKSFAPSADQEHKP